MGESRRHRGLRPICKPITEVGRWAACSHLLGRRLTGSDLTKEVERGKRLAMRRFRHTPPPGPAGDVAAMVTRARSTLAVEAALLVFVLTVTVFLTSASTN